MIFSGCWSVSMKYLRKYQSLSQGVKAGLWFTICNLLQRGISFITMPIFTRIMTQTNYGLFSTYASWYSFLLIFTSLNLSSYVFNKGMVRYEDDRDGLQASLQGLGFITTIIIFIIYWIFKDHINNYTGLDTPIMLCMFVHMFFEPPILLWTARQRFEYRYIAVIIVTLLITIFTPITGVIAIWIGEKQLLDRVIADAVVPFAFGLVIATLTVVKSQTLFSRKYWKYALSFNLPLIPHFLSTTLLNQADRVMITSIAGAEYTALYSVAYALGMVTTLFSTAIQQSLLPWLYSKLKNRDYCRIKDVTNITVAVVFIVCILLILIAPEIMLILAPSSYADAVWVIPPVCASVFFIYIYNLFANIEYYFEETKYVAIASVLAALANCGLNYIFINWYGYIAAGYTTLFCYAVLSYMHYIFMKKACRKHQFDETIFDFKFLLFLIILFLLIVTLIVAFYETTLIRYLIFLIVSIIVLVNQKILRQILNQVKG